MSNRPCIIVVTAPSGSGKTTLARRLMEAVPSIRFSVSATTRAPRAGEKNGQDYHFLSHQAFQTAIQDGALTEYEEVYPGCFYGTLVSEIDASSAAAPILLDIDVKGASRIKQLHGDRVLTVFITPPSLDTLAERLQHRGTENEHSVSVRLARAKDELKYEHTFDVSIVNDDLDTATADLIEHVKSFLATC